MQALLCALSTQALRRGGLRYTRATYHPYYLYCKTQFSKCAIRLSSCQETPCLIFINAPPHFWLHLTSGILLSFWRSRSAWPDQEMSNCESRRHLSRCDRISNKCHLMAVLCLQNSRLHRCARAVIPTDFSRKAGRSPSLEVRLGHTLKDI